MFAALDHRFAQTKIELAFEFDFFAVTMKAVGLENGADITLKSEFFTGNWSLWLGFRSLCRDAESNKQAAKKSCI